MTLLFDHERLTVYARARTMNSIVAEILAHARIPRKDLVDQVHRASTSVQLNIAEGSGEFARKEKARFYRIARRSATETGAALDLLVDWGTSARTMLSPRGLRCGKSWPCWFG